MNKINKENIIKPTKNNLKVCINSVWIYKLCFRVAAGLFYC